MTEPVDNAELIQRAAILKVIANATRDAYEDERRKADQLLNKGDRLIARSPLDGSKLGAVYKTDPDRECRITDEKALTDWMCEHHPALTELGYEICGSDTEVIDVLFEHAPHLLRQYRRIKRDDMRQLRSNAIALGQPIGPASEADVPGIEVHEPPGVVACKPDPDAIHAVLALHQSGRLQLDGRVLPAIEEAPNG